MQSCNKLLIFNIQENIKFTHIFIYFIWRRKKKKIYTCTVWPQTHLKTHQNGSSALSRKMSDRWTGHQLKIHWYNQREIYGLNGAVAKSICIHNIVCQASLLMTQIWIDGFGANSNAKKKKKITLLWNERKEKSRARTTRPYTHTPITTKMPAIFICFCTSFHIFVMFIWPFIMCNCYVTHDVHVIYINLVRIVHCFRHENVPKARSKQIYRCNNKRGQYQTTLCSIQVNTFWFSCIKIEQ